MPPAASPRTVTLEDVAREAGVSPSTVSRILTGSARVRADKAAQVRAAIERLGYKPNAFARGLALGASGSVGVLTQDIASPFYNDALHGIEQGLMGSGYSPLIISGHWSTPDETHAVELFMNRRVEAMIVLGGELPDKVLKGLSEKLPLAVLGRRLDLGPTGVSVSLDNRRAAAELVTHLISRGHRSIGHIVGPSSHLDARERLAGYREALGAAGLPFVETLTAQGDFREPSGLIATGQLLARHPEMTALFCANDQMAYGARLALYRQGLRVPEDVSLVGFDDLPGSSYTAPPLTSVRQPMAEIGAWLAHFVTAQLRGQAAETPNFALELRLRESVGWRRG